MTLGALVLGPLLAACSLDAPARDRVAESAVRQLAQALDSALAGAHVSDREQLTGLVRAAYPTVVQSTIGADLRYATYQGRGQRLGDDVPVALAVWERSSGADPFTDDVPRWHRYCAQLGVDLAEAGFRPTVVRCPRGTPEEPAVGSEDADSAPTLDHDAPDEGSLLIGSPARVGGPAGLYRPTAATAPPAPCLEDEIAVSLELLSTAGNTDEAELRVVNTSSSPCVVRGPLRLAVNQGGAPPSTGRAPQQSEVALAPRQSVTSPVSWRPSQKVGPTAQRITLTLPSGALPVRVTNAADGSPVRSDVGETLRIGNWQSPGYGVRAEDRTPAAVDIVAPCHPDDLAAQTRKEPGTSGSAPAPPTVSVINIGAAACRFGRGDGPAFQDLAALAGFAQTPVTVLRPGDQVEARVTTAVQDRPGQLVTGRWVAVTRE
ncbi:hypothetical protein JNB_11749 [Janibacter sp. HTCC2649]|nr:hypothetical protein JNB_11749 [Janibacter sp. HTCC2649]